MPIPLPVVPDCSEDSRATNAGWSEPFIEVRRDWPERSTSDMQPLAPQAPANGSLIADEVAWRRLPRLVDNVVDSAFAPMRFSRWRDPCESGGEYRSVTEPSVYTVGVALQPTDAAIVVDGRRINESAVRVGSILASGPGQRWHAEFRRRSDFLHIHFAPELLADCMVRSTGRRVDIHELFAYPLLLVDNVVLDLARALVATAQTSPGFADVGANGLGTAIAARVLELLHDAPQLSRVLSQGSRQSASGAMLAPWRMRKVLAFIDANLGRPLSLQMVADASGLSKMHFAALFRSSTGLSPSEFVAQRRIEKAQEVLLCTPIPVVEIALSLGFQTQAHFSTVFKRLIGEAPSEWRRRHASLESPHEGEG
ncbi:AraC family transcriptional regulator [Pararobbsia alpina]|uniref:helix-turn-helix domain-containing protein n=1 Tax=Pararobbsia alpina TaxID=621374 RepID=UPI0039A66DB2